MMTLKLNIYSENKKEIEKTLTAEGYELMLGTVEDIMQIIDVDKIDSDAAVAAMVVKGYRQLVPFIKDIFPEATDDDLRHAKVREIITLFKNVVKVIIEDLGLLKSGN